MTIGLSYCTNMHYFFPRFNVRVAIDVPNRNENISCVSLSWLTVLQFKTTIYLVITPSHQKSFSNSRKTNLGRTPSHQKKVSLIVEKLIWGEQLLTKKKFL